MKGFLHTPIMPYNPIALETEWQSRNVEKIFKSMPHRQTPIGKGIVDTPLREAHIVHINFQRAFGYWRIDKSPYYVLLKLCRTTHSSSDTLSLEIKT